MKHTTITKGIYSQANAENKSASLSTQEKVQLNNPYLLTLYPKTMIMKTIFTFAIALFIQTTVFSQVTSFTGKVKNERVDLSWATTVEKNISHFIIEKSTDGKNYSQAGIVFAYGNTNETMNYPFFEKNIKANNTGMIFYRLTEVTNDGIVVYTDITTVKLNNKSTQEISSAKVAAKAIVLVK